MSKEKLIPELRFPEFKNEEEWKNDIVDNLVLTVTPPKKLTSSNYQVNGKFPIIDQSKSFYCGWTNDEDAVISNDLPLVIFGDHTCIIKLAREPFAQGADGIKILKAKSQILTEYLFHYLQHNEVKMEDYKRHFSILKDKIVAFPKIENGEQQKIASCLSSLDEVIASHSQKLELLKDHKKGLMQNLFPQEREKVPKYRFKEFDKDGEWVEKTIGDFAPLQRGFDLLVDDIILGDYPVVFSNGILKYHKEFKVKAPGIVTGRSGTIGKVTYVEKDFWPHNTSLWVTDFCGNFPLFVYHYFVQIGLEQFSAGGGVPTLNRNDVHRSKIFIPISNDEQQKIASCLSSLDALITAQAEKVEQLKLHKKGLMQGLFPKMND